MRVWEKNNGNWFVDHLKQNKTSCNQTPPSTSTTNWTLKPLRKKHPRYALRKKKKKTVLFFSQQVTFVEFRSNPWSWSKNGMWNSSPGSSMFFFGGIPSWLESEINKQKPSLWSVKDILFDSYLIRIGSHRSVTCFRWFASFGQHQQSCREWVDKLNLEKP